MATPNKPSNTSRKATTGSKPAGRPTTSPSSPAKGGGSTNKGRKAR